MTGNGATERRRESCEQCGFDSDLYDRADTISSQRILPAVLGAAIEGLDGETLATRPDEQTWSIAEYLDHLREVVFANRFAIELAIADPGVDLGEPPSIGLIEDQKQIDLSAALAGIDNEYELMRKLLIGLSDEQWEIGAILGGEPHTVGWFGRHVLHDGLHHLGDIGRIRHGFGFGAQTVSGVVAGLHVSDGGVPKRRVESVVVGPSGLDGDLQNDRRNHGRPIQAVSLWSTDVIERLQTDGHPIAAGAAGENITISSVDWAGLRPGSRIDVGAVPMLVSAHAIPCSKNAQWFSDGEFNRILHERNPGSSRLYAIPLSTSEVSVGDPVTVEP